uniref:Uncharacterized protein n=1 Tax=Sus scrofa TaxID=9823 RepID=A0A8D0RNW8_PIG
MASLQRRNGKLTMVGMKFSRMMMERICFQSVVLSPSSRQMDSSASFTAAGGLAMDRTSTRCCFFMDFTAGGGEDTVRGAEPQPDMELASSSKKRDSFPQTEMHIFPA